MAHAGQPKRIPHHGRSRRNHRLAQILLEHFQDRNGGHAGPAEKDRVRRWRVNGAAELIGALWRLLVYVLDILEAAAADHVEAVLHQMGLGLERDLLVVWRAKCDPLDIERG